MNWLRRVWMYLTHREPVAAPCCCRCTHRIVAEIASEFCDAEVDYLRSLDDEDKTQRAHLATHERMSVARDKLLAACGRAR